MLLATVGVLPEGVSTRPAAHAGTKFFTDFLGDSTRHESVRYLPHADRAHQTGPPDVPAVTGHEFRAASFAACADCHGSGANEETLHDWRVTISNRIQMVKQNWLDA
jgi:hypothetical protein